MCWPHVYRNVVPKLARIKKVDGKVHDQLLEDIESLQWPANNEDTFQNAYDFLKSNTESSSKITAMFLMTFSHTFDSNGLSLLFLDGMKGLILGV